MAISSATLFHFTSSFETLKKILCGQGFWARYCIEYGWGEQGDKDFAVPMVCFCDIPLSQIHNHIKLYGGYGIGMSKEWAINNRMAPVHYLQSGSFATEILNELRDKVELKDKVKHLTFLKKYKGVMYRKNNKGKYKKYSDYIFYNEREWRYVPNVEPICVTAKDHKINNEDKLNEETYKHLLRFTSTDIKYLIVKTENQRMDLLKTIEKKYEATEEEITLLKSKVITCEQITNDF